MDVRTALREIERSARWIEVVGGSEKRIVFDDARAWEWFGKE
jgi:hypothetical protein